ncbi:MAG: DUF2914 domain-containing protein [Chitinispirillaceae bacterium]|nr:DUF2914 domain-containing protein [Chitinispirillaceae bacterium]
MTVRTTTLCILAASIVMVQAQPPAPAKMPLPPPPPPAQKTTVKKTAPVPKTAPPSGMIVSRASIALDVVDREPKDTGSVFPPQVKRLYCFTEIKNGAGEEIQHRWYWNDDLINTVPLGISSDRHRTYSAKTIVPGMTGEWVVSIVRTTNEEVLKTVHFQVK